MMKFDYLLMIRRKKQRKPGINNNLRPSSQVFDFTRSENSKGSTRLNNLWGGSTEVSSLLNEGSKNTKQPDRQITYSFNKKNAQRYKRCVNISEPAAVFWISINEKLVSDHQLWATAASSLFGYVGKIVGIMGHDCLFVWLLGIFLIVNCQLEFLEVLSLVISHWSLGQRFKERSLVIGHW